MEAHDLAVLMSLCNVGMPLQSLNKIRGVLEVVSISTFSIVSKNSENLEQSVPMCIASPSDDSCGYYYLFLTSNNPEFEFVEDPLLSTELSFGVLDG